MKNKKGSQSEREDRGREIEKRDKRDRQKEKKKEMKSTFIMDKYCLSSDLLTG